jgi:hypothetical protein
MPGQFICPVCGNPRPMLGICPYCDSNEAPSPNSDTSILNLELGGPTSEEALETLTQHIRAASEMQMRVLIVIHGYGSSGRGGSIRRTVREALENNYFSDRVDEYYHGEDLVHRSELYQALVKRRPTLKHHLKQFREGNAGMTLLLMRH